MAPRMNGFTKQIDIAAALFGLHEEVEDGSVVPEPEAASRLPHQQILMEPVDARCSPEPASGKLQRSGRDVEDRDVGEAALDEYIHQGRRTTADVEHGSVDGEVEDFGHLLKSRVA